MTFFSFTPTFTQGLVLGQLSILLLLAFILRYLFFDTNSPPSPPSADETESDDAGADIERHADEPKDPSLHIPTLPLKDSFIDEFPVDVTRKESLEWFNLLLNGLTQTYRTHLRGNLTGTAANEAARRRVERWAQTALQSSMMSPIKVHSVSLGTSAPRMANARMRQAHPSSTTHIDLDFTYTDTISMSLSTSLLLNYPTALFARLPISLTLSLSIFSGTITLVPPYQGSPTFILRLQPNFKLSIKQSSLMGSRAKLADVPKVHQIIEDRIRASITALFAEYRIMLPGIEATERVGTSIMATKTLHLPIDNGMTRKTVDVFVEN